MQRAAYITAQLSGAESQHLTMELSASKRTENAFLKFSICSAVNQFRFIRPPGLGLYIDAGL
jgi:hypothetical protein